MIYGGKLWDFADELGFGTNGIKIRAKLHGELHAYSHSNCLRKDLLAN